MLSFGGGGGKEDHFQNKIKFPPSLLRQATYEKTNALCAFEIAFCTS